jgi:predicted aminopeptidase
MIRSFKKATRIQKGLILAAFALLIVGLSGCETFSFYRQAIKGQYQLFANQQPIDKLAGNTNTEPRLRKQLQLVQELRGFAEKELKLPVDNHYRKYVDVHRPYVVWNVEAAREFSMEPKSWWYPLVGSLEYRGYFSERAAQHYGGTLRKKGYDVYVGGAIAYSTLGWFKDPVLNTFIFDPEPDLAETLFHELGHQRVFARGDTDFNEAFATTVGQEGARRWLRTKGDTNAFERYEAERNRNNEFVHLVMDARHELEALYGDERNEAGKIKASKKPPEIPPDQLRERKKAVFEQLRNRYAQMKAQWGGNSEYDNFFSRQLNNAQLNSVAAYYDLVPGFMQLLKLNGDDLEKFYDAAEKLSKKPKKERQQWLRTHAGSGSVVQSEDKHSTGANRENREKALR